MLWSFYCLICNEVVQKEMEGCPDCVCTVCPSCLADARLGRMVRGIHPGERLGLFDDGWTLCGRGIDYGMPTPEEALAAAGVAENTKVAEDASVVEEGGEG